MHAVGQQLIWRETLTYSAHSGPTHVATPNLENLVLFISYPRMSGCACLSCTFCILFCVPLRVPAEQCGSHPIARTPSEHSHGGGRGRPPSRHSVPGPRSRLPARTPHSERQRIPPPLRCAGVHPSALLLSLTALPVACQHAEKQRDSWRGRRRTCKCSGEGPISVRITCSHGLGLSRASGHRVSCTVARALWRVHCGACTVARALWAVHCGPCTVGRALWRVHCGPCTVGRVCAVNAREDVWRKQSWCRSVDIDHRTPRLRAREGGGGILMHSMAGWLMMWSYSQAWCVYSSLVSSV